MKKIVTLAITGLASLSLVACGNTASSSKASEPKQVSHKVTKVNKVAIASNDANTLFTSDNYTQLKKNADKDAIIAVDKEVNKLPPSQKKTKLQAVVKKAKKLFNKRLENEEQHLSLSDGTKITTTHMKWFNVNQHESWNGNLHITRVTVSTTKPFSYDGDDGTVTCRGFIQVDYSFTASSDITLYDDQTVLSTSDGQQTTVDSTDSTMVGDINKGVTKKGVASFFLPKSDINTIATIRLKLDVVPQDINSDDLHTFDITIPLEK